MFSFETVILYLTIVTVTINGQNTALPITPSMTATCIQADTDNVATNAFDTDSLIAPITCATTTAAIGSLIRINLMDSYIINSITIANKVSINLSVPGTSITTTATGGLNQVSGTNGMTVTISPTTSVGILCTAASPGTISAPFGTITTTAVIATYNCNNFPAQYIVVSGPGSVGVAVCAFSVMLKDPTTTTTTPKPLIKSLFLSNDVTDDREFFKTTAGTTITIMPTTTPTAATTTTPKPITKSPSLSNDVTDDREFFKTTAASTITTRPTTTTTTEPTITPTSTLPATTNDTSTNTTNATSMNTTTTKAEIANTIVAVAKSSRYVRFDWSIYTAMILVVITITMNNGQH